MFTEHRLPSPRMTLVIALVLLGLLLAGLSPLVPRVSAVTFTGNTDALVNLGQPVRDSSSAIPIFGFSMNASALNTERLRSVTITFNPRPDWQPGNDQDLRALSPDGRFSGVALYRDDGSVDDALDAGDHAITMASGPTWNGNDVTFDFTAGTGTTEYVPTSVTGRYQWLVVIRTSNNPVALTNGETISATIRAGAIVATSNAGTISQPPFAVNANDLTVDLTSGFNIVGASGFPWVGPSTAMVNSKAVMGIHVVDGGIIVNRGIQDSITSMQFSLVQTSGVISSGDFKPISTNPATSGIALYRSNGSGVAPTTISPITFPAGGATFTMTFSPGLAVPHVGTGRYDFYIFVRTASFTTGNSFRIDIPANGIRIRGLMGAQVDADLRTPMVLQTTSNVLADSTPPMTTAEGWFTGSNYLYASGLDLHFGHAMTSVQTAFAAGWAFDGESGLSNATFKAAPSLASSPPPYIFTGSGFQVFFGAYGFNNVSLDTSSPADVTLCDRVGNCIAVSQEGRVYRYIYETSKVIILPSPGWIITGPTPPFWIDPSTGKLWFSSLIAGPGNATIISVNVASLSGVDLTSISASVKPSLGGPTPASTTFPAGTFSSYWSTFYTINASSNSLAAPVTITARDNFGNVGIANFDYGLDTTGPNITVLNPTQGSTVSGNIVAKATITDDHTKVLYVQFLVDSKTYFGFFDGTNYFTAISTADFADGKHRIQVQAWDNVGNQNTVGVDVTFSNAAAIPPSVSLVTPLDGSYIQGLYTVSASATDNIGVKSANLTLRRLSDNGLVFSTALGFALASGLWQVGLDTLGVADGSYRLTVAAVNVGGLSAAVTVTVKVDNHAPVLVVASPIENAYVRGTISINATASGVFLSGVTYSVDGGAWLPLGNSLDTTTLADGHHIIAVRASDLSGKTTIQNVDVTVANTASTGSMSSLAIGQVVKGVFTFRVFAWNAVGIKAVTLAVAGQTVYMAYNPQSGYWEYTMDTTTLSDGTYTAQPTITDQSGRTTTPAATSFQVKNQAEPQTAMQSFVAMLPPLYFGFLVFAFVVAVLIAKSWGKPEGESPRRHRREREPMIEVHGQPPNPPSPPPPGNP